MNEKSISLVYEDTKKAVAQAIADSKLPPVVCRDIIKNLLLTLEDLTLQQYNLDLAAYEKNMEENIEE